jgi:hypothetical protein
MGWEEGARVMALSNIATAERNGKHLTLHAKDVHSLILLFADDKSTATSTCNLSENTNSSPTPPRCRTGDTHNNTRTQHAVPNPLVFSPGASVFHQQLLRIPKTEPLFAFSYLKASGV